jgi:spore coat protein U-like protein
MRPRPAPARLFAGGLLLLAPLPGPLPILAGRAEAATTSCSAFSSSGIIFSAYDTVGKAAVDGTGTITFTCMGTGTDTLNVIINGGSAGVCSPRQMKNGSLSLAYNIYRESARTSIWCDGSQRFDVPMDYSTGATQTKTVTVNGRVTSGQNPTYATYTDTLNISLKQGGGVFRTSTMTVSGSVAPTCSITAGTLAFGTYTPNALKDAVATISVDCSNTAPYQVSLGGGENQSGSTRRMAGPSGSFLNYGLFSNSGRTTGWGDGTAVGAIVSGTGSGTAQSLTVYGQIPAGQYARPGSYTDSVFVTVTY